jgi:hypothetical protein
VREAEPVLATLAESPRSAGLEKRPYFFKLPA